MKPVSSAFARFPRRCSSVRAVSGSHRSSTSRRTAAAGAGASLEAMAARSALAQAVRSLRLKRRNDVIFG